MNSLSKKLLFSFIGIGAMLISQQAFSADLAQVYQDALDHDQTYANAFATERAAAEASPQALAALLPKIGASSSESLSRTTNSGSSVAGGVIGSAAGSNKARAFAYGLSLSQQVFNFPDWLGLSSAHNTVKAAYATFSYAQQALIQTTISNYLNVLQTEDLLRYAEEKKKDLEQQYQQADEAFKVGTKTMTDVYQARSAYEGAVSAAIAAKNNVAIAYENLSVSTTKHYQELKPLGNKFPLISPHPNDIQSWMKAASQQNWQVVSARYTMFADKDNLSEQKAAYLPSVSATAGYSNTVTNNTNNGVSASERAITPSAALDLNVPIFNDGAGASSDISSAIRQYIALYEAGQTTFELTDRQQVANARTYYLDVNSDISKIEADRKTIVYDRSSLEGTVEGYKVGTQTMIDVLNQENTLYSDLSTYATDRYQYVNDAISLKIAAGTLSEKDLESINTWLAYSEK
jgi:outer membrane protein